MPYTRGLYMNTLIYGTKYSFYGGTLSCRINRFIRKIEAGSVRPFVEIWWNLNQMGEKSPFARWSLQWRKPYPLLRNNATKKLRKWHHGSIVCQRTGKCWYVNAIHMWLNRWCFRHSRKLPFVIHITHDNSRTHMVLVLSNSNMTFKTEYIGW